MASSRSSRVLYHCSFCGKNQDQVKRLIAGPGAVYICDECVELCREIIDEEWEAILADKKPPKQGLDDMVRRGNEKLREFERINR